MNIVQSSPLPIYEKILLEKIFYVKTSQAPSSFIPNSESTFLPNFANDLSSITSLSLLTSSSYFDSMMMERLSIPDTDILKYLRDAFERACSEKEFEFNKGEAESMKFIDFSMEIIGNFCFLVLSTPEIFEAQSLEKEIIQETDQEKSFALKIYLHFYRYGLSEAFFGLINENCDRNSCFEFKSQLIKYVLQSQKNAKFYESKAYFNLSFFILLLSFDDYLILMHNLAHLPWIPAHLNAVSLEMESPLGILGQVGCYCANNRGVWGEVLEKMGEEFEKIKYKKDFDFKMQSFSEQVSKYNCMLSEIFKVLLKKRKDLSFHEETMEWLNSVIISNFSRTKLGNRLANPVNLTNFASEGFLNNLFDVFLEISSPFLDREGSKFEEMIKKINPLFLKTNKRAMTTKRAPIYSKENLNPNPFPTSDYGTITEFFFLSLDLFHISYLQTMQNYNEDMTLLKRIEKRLKKLNEHSFGFSDLKKKQEYLKKLYFCYNLLLFSERRIKKTLNLLDITMELLIRWTGMELCCLENSKIDVEILYMYPEDYLNFVFEFNVFYLKYFDGYLGIISKSKINNILTMMVILNSKAVSVTTNPYLKAKFVELLFYFVERDQLVVKELLRFNPFCDKYLLPGLISFYIEIEFTGASHQFYSKYQYRHYCVRILEILWDFEDYSKQIKEMMKEPIFERFVNLVMNDTTYCMDEGFDKLIKLEELNKKKQTQPLSAEDEKNLESFESSSRYFLLEASQCIKVIYHLSKFVPEAFLTQTFCKRIAEMLNYFLSQISEPKLISILESRANKKEFDPSVLTIHLLTIYGNLSTSPSFCQHVQKDARSFSFSLLSSSFQNNSSFLSSSAYSSFSSFLLRLSSSSLPSSFPPSSFSPSSHPPPSSFLPPPPSSQPSPPPSSSLSSSLLPPSLLPTSSFEAEAPDEFVDPITAEIMEDPVRLPTSGVILDRATAKQILLNDEVDPFNRKKLRIEDLEEMGDLRRKIEQWTEGRRRGGGV